MSTVNFTTAFPGTHVTSWTDDEGFSMVTVGIPGDEVSTLWVGDYEHVLRVWDSLDGHVAPMDGDPLFDALEAYAERLQDEYALAYAESVDREIMADNEAERALMDAGL